jgi:hypothetical protein
VNEQRIARLVEARQLEALPADDAGDLISAAEWKSVTVK